MDSLLPNIQRVVLLIDLQPLFSPQNPKPNPTSYFTPILSSIRRILSSPQLASSLSALKFFFSSLPPISSSSKTHRLLGKCPNSLSFNHHSQTLIALSETLELISSTPDLCNFHTSGASKASLLAKSLVQLENEYAWEVKRNTESEQDFLRFRPNLVILFSSVLQDASTLAQFVDLEAKGDGSVGFDDFAKKFLQMFGPAKERLDSRDITLSLVWVKFEVESKNEKTTSSWFEGVFKEQNWGFSSTDRIILGSSIIPMGLIFPFIGCPIGQMQGRNSKSASIGLILEISDVNGNPLKCKIRGLEALHSQIIDQRSGKMLNPLFQTSGREITEICVEGVKKIADSEKFIQNASSLVLIHGFLSKPSAEEFIPNKILEPFCTEKGELVQEEPLWQLFLSFLYSRSYSAMVSVPVRNGTCFEGVLVPFTINHGLLYVLEKGFLETERCRCGLSEIRSVKRRRKQVVESLLESKDLISFQNIALSYPEVSVLEDICDLYFRKFSSKLKKMKFLKCWVNQMRDSCTGSCNSMVKERESEVEVEREDIQSEEIPFEDRMEINEEEGLSPFSSVEEAEAFLGNVKEKIEKDLVLEEGNLGISVESLVHLILAAVSKKMGGEGEEGVALEVANLILKKPKDLIAQYKGSSYNTNYKLREHEVQILFRMEILKSLAGSQIEETRKQKMIKEICHLLEFIDLNLQTDPAREAATSIIIFAEKTIKSRYTHSVPEIVEQIYSQMEFDMSEQNETLYSLNTDLDTEPKIEGLSISEPFDEMIEKRIVKARESIDRQRRFKSFTSWMPDLHRVWALKKPKFERDLLESRPTSSTRKRRRRLSGSFVVHETPMTGTKETTSGTATPKQGRSLCKALFQASPSTDPTRQ